MQLNCLKFGMKNGTDVTLNLSSNVVRNSSDETNFPHKLLLLLSRNTPVSRLLQNGLLANIKFSKAQLSKMVQ